MELGTLLIEQSRIGGEFRVLEMPNKNHEILPGACCSADKLVHLGT